MNIEDSLFEFAVWWFTISFLTGVMFAMVIMES